MISHYTVYPNSAPSVVGAAPSLIDSTSITDAKLVYSSTNNGRPTNRGGVAQRNAITTIAFCNTAAPSASDETVNSVTVNVFIVSNSPIAETPNTYNRIVSELTIPAGETVFFSEERMVLEGGDEIYVAASDSSPTPKLSVTVSTLPV
jgi:hypothetical protein